MPKRKERMAGYIRESDPTLAVSTTIASQAKAVRLYGEKEHYIYEPQHEYKEALSAYTIPYMERPQLLNLLEAAKRKEFDVLVVSEVRALSRRQVEVFIIYDLLQKYGVRLETVKEKFEDDAMGRLILSLRAAYAEIEREQSYVRMQRGKKDRIEISNAPNGHPKAAYGYVFVDTEREVKGRYEFNKTIIYVDREGKEWSEYLVCQFIFDSLKKRVSLRGIAAHLNDLGIPPPSKPRKGIAHWSTFVIYRMSANPIYMGEVWVNKYKRIGKRVIERPQEEWLLLPEGTAPAFIDKETFLEIQKQFAINKQESLRSNTHQDSLGLLRAGYIYCAICKRRMQVYYRGRAIYVCRQKTSPELGVVLNHRTSIGLKFIDELVWEKVVAVLKNYQFIRRRVGELREANMPVVDSSAIEAALSRIRRSMQNLYTLAENATDDETMAELTHRMENLAKQKRDAEALLYDIADDEEERAAIETEIAKFEAWAVKVQPLLTDPSYEPTYEEKRLAIRILGIRVSIFPTLGEYPYRYHIGVTVPAIMEKVSSGTNDGWIVDPAMWEMRPIPARL